MSSLDNLLHVWVYPEAEHAPVLCGQLELLRGRYCLFSYADEWLRRPGAFALSPDLPLQQHVFVPLSALGIHPIFEDAGPGRWGKNIISKVFNPIRQSPIDYLELVGENRIGSLGFSRSKDRYEVQDRASFQTIDLPSLMQASQALERQMPIDEKLWRFLYPGLSAGGARPKAVIRHKGQDWIAKFPSEGDDYNICAIEHASMILAEKCGISVAKSELLSIGNQSVLLIKRFDRENEARIHVASARTLLFAHDIQEHEEGYADLAEIARRLSPSPKDDNHELFRRMVFNIFIENTDDHNKNHAFLHQNGKWKLSPAYDVLPQYQGLGFHQMRIGRDGSEARIDNALSECERFMLKRDEAESIVKRLYDLIIDWKEAFAKAGVSQRDIDAADRYILREQIFRFGKVPENVVPAAKDQYPGKIVAVGAQYVYQSIGRNRCIQRDRKEMPQLILGNKDLGIQSNKERDRGD